MYSLEYCHVTPGRDVDEVIAQANVRAPKILKAYEGVHVEKCVMVDDLRRKDPVTTEEVAAIVDRLTVKPDCVFLESAFVPHAASVIAMTDPEVVRGYTFDEFQWLRSAQDRYQSIQEFLVSKKGEGGVISFSCPALVATFYAYRLGLLPDVDVAPIYGARTGTVSRLVNVLQTKYLPVESNAQLILTAAFPKSIDSIEWHFLADELIV